MLQLLKPRTYKNILFIGANDMSEIEDYARIYKNGIFIEAIPDVFIQLKNNLEIINKKYNTQFKALNCLVSNEIGKEYTFNIFNNNGASSSIYQPNNDVWQWPSVKQINTINLISTTIKNVLKEQEWENIKYDVVLDVQGAELDVLNGFGENNFKNIESLTTEISTKPFYLGGVIFEDLNNFIINRGFKLVSFPKYNHCDVKYIRI
jgi:FkbM family methyltransferase